MLRQESAHGRSRPMTTTRNNQSGLALKLFLSLVAVGVASAISAVTAAAAPAIVTQNGPLKGTETATMNEYLGIPYAVPPVGPLRWTPPQPHGRWHGVFQATQFGSECTQPGPSGSENCLFLNVYTPRGRERIERGWRRDGQPRRRGAAWPASYGLDSWWRTHDWEQRSLRPHATREKRSDRRHNQLPPRVIWDSLLILR